MKKIIRSIHSTLGKALVLCAFALTIPVTTSVAFDSQEPGGAEQQNGNCHDELTFTQIDYREKDVIVTDTLALGINDLGQIVGVFVDGAGASHGFLLENGEFTRINYVKDQKIYQTTCYGINDLGHIVGNYQDEKGLFHNFLLVNGHFTEIAISGAVQSQARGINNLGHIVGNFADSYGVIHSFLWRNGVITTIEFPGSAQRNINEKNGAPIGINNNDQIVSEFIEIEGTEERLHGYLWENGRYTQIDPLEGNNTGFVGINDHGQIALVSTAPMNPSMGYLLDRGTLILINNQRFVLTIPQGLNDLSQVVGNLIDSNGRTHGFVTLPICPR